MQLAGENIQKGQIQQGKRKLEKDEMVFEHWCIILT